MTEFSFAVEQETEKKRIDKLLSELMPNYSRSFLQRLIDEGGVRVNSIIATPKTKIKTGDKIEVCIEDPEPIDAQPENIPIDIVYQDEDIAVVNKPQGMVVHPAAGNYHGTLVNALLFHLDGLSGINGAIRPGIVHRIDKDTSGLLVVGCSLILTAILLAFAYYARPRLKENISFKDAFIIGVAQAFAAILPGLSRSGSTIATGLLLGDRKDQVARFSFLMVLIPILGEAMLDLMKGGFHPSETGISALALTAGFVTAFLSGLFACSWMINIVKKGKLIYFAVYCLIVGTVSILYSVI